jgi:hypothetical protein
MLRASLRFVRSVSTSSRSTGYGLSPARSSSIIARMFSSKLLTSSLQVLVEEGGYLRVGVEAVLQFGQTVALVLV